MSRISTARSGVEWLYGRNVVKLALAEGSRRPVYKLVATTSALKALHREPPPDLTVEVRSGRELDELTQSQEHQGVALSVGPYAYASVDDVLSGDLVVALDEISDPRNLGATARSALAVGASGLIIPKHRSASVTPAAVKASAGAIEHLRVAQVTNTVAALEAAKECGFWVYGAAGQARQSYLDLDLDGRVLFVFGAEGRGLRPLVARTCDALVSIPMDARVESLNVSVAAALLLYEASRQRSVGAREGR